MKTSKTLKNWLGLLLIVVTSLIQLILIFAMIATFMGDESSEAAQSLLSFFFVIALFSFMLFYGFRLWKSRSTKPIISDSADDGKTISVHIKIEFEEYRRLLLRMTYTNPIILYLNVLGLTMLTFSLLNSPYDYSGTIIGLVFLGLPTLTFLQSRRLYNASKTLREASTYEFTPDRIHITGETYETTLQWNTLYKVKEWNDWFLLYSNKNVAMILPKKGFSSRDDIDTVRRFAMRTNGVIKELGSPSQK